MTLLIIVTVIFFSSLGSQSLFQPKMTSTPDFSLTDLDENTFRLSDFRGKVVIIDFMATWCGYCEQQIVINKEVWETYSSQVVMMLIDIDPRETEDMLRRLALQFSPTWIWARDTANLAQTFEVVSIPKTVIIDRGGEIRFSHTGVTSTPTLIQEIEKLVK